MTLADVKKGQKFVIASIPDNQIRAQAIRFGLNEGAEAECAETIASGPVIIKRGRQEIAIGRRLAMAITVKS